MENQSLVRLVFSQHAHGPSTPFVSAVLDFKRKQVISWTSLAQNQATLVRVATIGVLALGQPAVLKVLVLCPEPHVNPVVAMAGVSAG